VQAMVKAAVEAVGGSGRWDRRWKRPVGRARGSSSCCRLAGGCGRWKWPVEAVGIRPQLKERTLWPSTVSETHPSYKCWHPILVGCSSLVSRLWYFFQGWALPMLANWGMQVLVLKECGLKLLVKLDQKNEVGGVPYEPTV
jgi:hypothetical protein